MMLCTDKRLMVQAQYCSEWTELWYDMLVQFLCYEMTQPELCEFIQVRSQGECRGAMHPPKSAKRSTFNHKMGQKWGVCKRVKGMRFRKFTLWVQKVHILNRSCLCARVYYN